MQILWSPSTSGSTKAPACVAGLTHSTRGRLDPPMSCPCNTEMTLTVKEQAVSKPEEEIGEKKNMSQAK